MRVGVQLPEVERVVRWPELAEMARAIEDGGFDSIWVGDHLLYRHPDGVVGPWEAWATLTAVAAITERVTLGPLVAALPFHNPALLAKQVATVHEISGGRLSFGVGAGWNQTEFDAFGLPYQRRVDRFEDSIGVIRRLLAGETVTHHSEFVTLTDCVIKPASRFGGPPIFVGSNSSRMLAITLPWVDGWNTWFDGFDNDPATLASLAARIDRACAEVGRDPVTLDKSAAVLVQFGRPPAISRGSAPWRGSSVQLAERLAEVAAAGVDHVQLVLDPITLGSIETAAEMLGEFRSQSR
jgi:probable F420-dependent oxidoreductase